jgi:uncharacterized OB-fold protein
MELDDKTPWNKPESIFRYCADCGAPLRPYSMDCPKHERTNNTVLVSDAPPTSEA